MAGMSPSGGQAGGMPNMMGGAYNPMMMNTMGRMVGIDPLLSVPPPLFFFLTIHSYIPLVQRLGIPSRSRRYC